MSVAANPPTNPAPTTASPLATTIFAGGCFWCIESELQAVPGVQSVVSGYTGGKNPHPTYEEVSSGQSGHIEAVQVTYQPAQVSYEKLLEVYWDNIDPTDAGGQFADRGSQYATVIYYASPTEQAAAEASKAAREAKTMARLGKPIVTRIEPAQPFYAAEDYHQDYSTKNPLRYEMYKYGSGRPATLEKIWGEKK